MPEELSHTYVNDLRAKILRGEPVEPEEFEKAVRLVRQARKNSVTGGKPAKPTIDTKDLLSTVVKGPTS